MVSPTRPVSRARTRVIDPFCTWLRWLETPAGKWLLAQEQAWLDRLLEDCFGHYAVQIVPPGLDALRHNRAVHRFRAALGADCPNATPDLVVDPTALPFADSSVDLLVLAHGHEIVDDPHALFREAARVLVAGGRLAVLGINPRSSWSLLMPLSASACPLVLGQWLTIHRLRDWFSLLGLTPVASQQGLLRPPTRRTARFGHDLAARDWIERAGNRWTPGLGGLYALCAEKRPAEPALLAPAFRRRPRVATAPVGATLSPSQID